MVYVEGFKRTKRPWVGHSRTGRDAWNTDRTRSDSNTVSTTWAIHSTFEPCKDSGGENFWTNSCKVTLEFPCGSTKLLYPVGSSYDDRSIVEVCLIAGGISSQKERQAYFPTAVDPMNIPMLTPRFTENEPRRISYTMGSEDHAEN